jgi:sulfate/thiosulfate transport system permease protein
VNIAVARPIPQVRALSLPSAQLVRGLVGGYLSLIVLIPLAAVAWKSTGGGWTAFWRTITEPDAIASLELTVLVSTAVVLVNIVTGTMIAWVLVRDRFPGKRLVNSVIDLPFALPTIVAGLTLLILYGPQSPLHVSVAYTRAGVALALLFVTLPFVVRAVQPVLAELDTEMEEAAASLGAGQWTIFRHIIFPNLRPAILGGAGLAFARSIGEFGSVALISGNIPYQTEVTSVHIYGQIESGNLPGAAALSVTLLAISLVVLTAINLLSRRGTAP